MQDQGAAGLTQMHQGLETIFATQTLMQPLCLVLLTEAVGHVGQVAEGLSVSWPKRRRSSRPAGGATCSRRRIGSKANSCYARPSLRRPRRKPASSRPWPLPAASRPNPGNCGRPRTWRDCGSARASGTTPARYWPRSTAGSPRASTPPTCRRPRRCWRHWRDPICRVSRLGSATRRPRRVTGRHPAPDAHVHCPHAQPGREADLRQGLAAPNGTSYGGRIHEARLVSGSALTDT